MSQIQTCNSHAFALVSILKELVALTDRTVAYFIFCSVRVGRGGCENMNYVPKTVWGHQRQFSENIRSEDDLRSRIFGAFFVKIFCLPASPKIFEHLKNGIIDHF